jgi:diguanylate cyclase (GGDEF)-like protein
LRSSDVICRYGGEEFAVLLPGAGPDDALRVAQRLHAAIGTQPVDSVAGPQRVTVSVGLAEPGPEALDGLLQRADDALYRAKKTGRDRVATVPSSAGPDGADPDGADPGTA